MVRCTAGSPQRKFCHIQACVLQYRLIDPLLLIRTHRKFVSTLGEMGWAVVIIIWRWYLIVVWYVLAFIVIFLEVLISLAEVVLALVMALVSN